MKAVPEGPTRSPAQSFPRDPTTHAPAWAALPAAGWQCHRAGLGRPQQQVEAGGHAQWGLGNQRKAVESGLGPLWGRGRTQTGGRNLTGKERCEVLK